MNPSQDKRYVWILKSPEGIPVREFQTYHGALVAGYSKYGLQQFKVVQDPPEIAIVATPFLTTKPTTIRKP